VAVPLPFAESEIGLLTALLRARIRFMVVGLSAATLQVAPVVTQDVALWFEKLGDQRISQALQTVGAAYVPPSNLNPPMLAGTGAELFDIVLRRDALAATTAVKRPSLCRTARGSEPSERLQVFHQVLALLRRKPEVETRVVAVDNIQQGLKTAVMVKPTHILWLHEESPFADVKPCQVHCRVSARGRSARLEAVDLHLGRCVIVPARLSPYRRVVATGAVRFAAEKSLATLRGSHVEVGTGSGFWRWK